MEEREKQMFHQRKEMLNKDSTTGFSYVYKKII
jgi:hypothetical protein